MENTGWKEKLGADPFFPRYVCVISQYESKVNAEAVMKTMKNWQNTNTTGEKLSKKKFHFRMAEEEDAIELTGFGYNAIMPFLTKIPLLVLLSADIAKLSPAYFWLGGGEVDLKLGISVEEFVTLTGAIVGGT
jgi:prolyl-tRNA editing enzyme YbaK/EbsC (Cys-tRNA(Pro) deacylase)